MAEFDQEAFCRQTQAAQQALEHLAPVVGRYMALLVEAGLTRSEALLLVSALQQAFLANQAAQRVEGRSE